MRRALPFLALAALVVVLVIGLTQAGGGDDGTAGDGPSLAELQRAVAGAPGPIAALYEEAPARVVASSIDDYRRRLRALRGYPVVVNVWGSWCAPCKLEFPHFQEAVRRRGKTVAFLGINLIDNKDAAERFLAKRPVPYPSLEDGNGGITREAAPGARGAPHTIFYDRSGKRVLTHQGQYTSVEDLLADIDKYAGA